jgi:hypothetical protein
MPLVLLLVLPLVLLLVLPLVLPLVLLVPTVIASLVRSASRLRARYLVKAQRGDSLASKGSAVTFHHAPGLLSSKQPL